MLVLENWFIFILYTPQIKIILLTEPNFCIKKISSTNNYNIMNKKDTFINENTELHKKAVLWTLKTDRIESG